MVKNKSAVIRRIRVISVLLAAGLELTQALLPYRGYNPNDMVANAAVVGIG